MARYIDADKLVEMYERSANDDWNKRTSPSSWAEAFECAIADIDDQPTADVVPREEVEWLLDDFQRSIRADAKVGMSAGEILLHINNMLAELKKKYIGDKR